MVSASHALAAGEPEANERAAERLLATTVTVRMTVHGAVPQADEVVVASGVSLGNGHLVTLAGDRDPRVARFRITLPTGEQAEAKLRVWDHYSGLLLLKIDTGELPGLELAKDLPKIGATVLTAAAAGIERPAVSAGVLGGADRTLPVVDLPPLLQCDVRTTETSSGAAVVDRDGHLIGIIAAITVPGERPGWSYAVPAFHVERLLGAEKDGQLIELKRRRPAVGFTLGPAETEGTVQVERVEDGP
ncbi:MAG TPA: serine protease, partial [Pirellulales bacterium]|nr:serine protease [Pirellulales bacterium]